MKEFLIDLLEKGKESNKELLSTHPMTQEQLSLWEEFEAAGKQKEAAETAVRIARKKFWNKVEGDLSIFDNNMKVNTDTSTIEVYKEKEDSNS